jgi:hypothetical protein
VLRDAPAALHVRFYGPRDRRLPKPTSRAR